MKTSRLINISLALAMLATLHVPASHAEPSIYTNAIFQKGDCGLTVEDPHISGSMLKKSQLGIKINVTSICKYPQQKFSADIELLRKGAFGWVSIKHFPVLVEKPEPSPFKIEIKNAFIQCKNTKATIYLARATAQVTIAGKTYVSPLIYSNKTAPIKCGF